ncbi:hypothetical protein [Streptomyces sp. NPDC059631]|uniref:hypothetical protein n=1 Tax=unclassified Streptomyces TaxID=2593676 RepID=UPI0036A39D7B
MLAPRFGVHAGVRAVELNVFGDLAEDAGDAVGGLGREHRRGGDGESQLGGHPGAQLHADSFGQCARGQDRLRVVLEMGRQ